MVTATEKSATVYGPPLYGAIVTVLNDAARAGGDWVGPAPRVTRTTHPGSATEGFQTTVAWPIDLRDDLLDERLRQLREGVSYALSRVGTWYNLSITPYSEALNGPESFWTSGTAARTRTRDDFPTGLSRIDPDQNPIGPDDPAVRPRTVEERLGGAGESAGQAIGALTTLLVVGAIAYGVVVLAPMIAKSRPNPGPSRRRRSAR